IEISWEVVKKCRDDNQTVAGMVKNANLKVFAPVINWYVCRLVGSNEKTQIGSWPLQSMNMITDQVLLSRLLTADRHKSDPWCRTCIVLRPFHAVAKKLDQQYSNVPGETPADLMLKPAKNKDGDSSFERDNSWLRDGEFRDHNDPFVQMPRNFWYAGCYIGC